MNKDLLNKEVVGIFDIRGIQNYIFNHSSDVDSLVASDIFKDLLSYAFDYAKKKMENELPADSIKFCSKENNKIDYFHDENVKVQVISAKCGNGLVLFREGWIAQKFSHYTSIFFVENNYRLNICCAFVERTSDYVNDNKRLYEALDKSKQNMPQSDVFLSFDFTQVEKFTGLPASLYDETYKEHISVETKKLRQLSKNQYYTQRIEMLDALYNNNNSLAFVHIDGNSMGMSIAKLLNKQDSYESFLSLKFQTQSFFEDSFKNIVQNCVIWLAKTLNLQKKYYSNTWIENVLFVCHCGGDDINFIIDPKYAFLFSEKVILELSKIEFNLAGKHKLNLSYCAGIAFMANTVSQIDGFSCAEKICSICKKRAKDSAFMDKDRITSWIDFNFFYDTLVFDIEKLRKRLKSNDGYYNMILRPYSLDECHKDKPYSYRNFKNTLLTLQHLNINKINLRDVNDYIYLGKISKIKLMKLAQSHGVDEFVDYLQSRDVYSTLKETNCRYSTIYDSLDVLTAFEDIKL